MSTEEETCCNTHKLGLIYGALLLRVWLGVRAIQTGIEKYAGTKASDKAVDGPAGAYGMTDPDAVKNYALENYHGVPSGLMKKFEAEPMMLKFGLPLYDKILGPVLIILGVTILIGLASRTSLFLLGLLYVSLTWGLILINQNDGVAWLGTHMVLITLALMLSDHNRLAVLKKW